ncbi:MAG: ribosome maturation factor RimM [Nocardioidaceae bacterium]
MDVVIGRIGRAHGIRGELAVDIRTDEPDLRFTIGAALATDPASAGPLTVAAARPHGGRLLVRFEEVRDRTAAEGLRGVLLTVALDDIGQTPGPEEFYDHQLVGLRVTDHAGSAVGDVVDVLHSPGHDVLVVRRDAGGEALVPFVRDLVPDIDLGARALTVSDRPGLLDPETLE